MDIAYIGQASSQCPLRHRKKSNYFLNNTNHLFFVLATKCASCKALDNFQMLHEFDVRVGCIFQIMYSVSNTKKFVNVFYLFLNVAKFQLARVKLMKFTAIKLRPLYSRFLRLLQILNKSICNLLYRTVRQ